MNYNIYVIVHIHISLHKIFTWLWKTFISVRTFCGRTDKLPVCFTRIVGAASIYLVRAIVVAVMLLRCQNKTRHIFIWAREHKHLTAMRSIGFALPIRSASSSIGLSIMCHECVSCVAFLLLCVPQFPIKLPWIEWSVHSKLATSIGHGRSNSNLSEVKKLYPRSFNIFDGRGACMEFNINVKISLDSVEIMILTCFKKLKALERRNIFVAFDADEQFYGFNSWSSCAWNSCLFGRQMVVNCHWV